jgi:hypothetical protein
MNLPQFKIGDILQPSKKGTSNYWLLKGLLEVKVIDNDLHPSYSKKNDKYSNIKRNCNWYTS